MKKTILALTLCMGFVVSLASSAEDAGKAKRIVTFEESFNAGGLISLRGYPTRWITDAQGHDVLAERGNRMAAPSATQSTDAPLTALSSPTVSVCGAMLREAIIGLWRRPREVVVSWASGCLRQA